MTQFRLFIFTMLFASWALSLPLANLGYCDPCEHWDIDQVEARITLPLPEEIGQLAQFDSESSFNVNPVELKKALKTTATFKNIPDSQIHIQELKVRAGNLNLAIFTVEVDSPKSSFIVKAIEYDPARSFLLGSTTGCAEFDHLWKLNESLITHPACFLPENQKNQKLPIASYDDLRALPSIARIVESFHDGRACFGVMEKAPGVSIRTILGDQSHSISQLKKIFFNYGKKFGTFHRLFSRKKDGDTHTLETWSHGDSHIDNVFYHAESGQITFIDNGSLGQPMTLPDEWNQYWKVDPFLSLMDRGSGQNIFRRLIEEKPEELRALQIYLAFAKGYLSHSQFPEAIQASLTQQLSKRCFEYVPDSLIQEIVIDTQLEVNASNLLEVLQDPTSRERIIQNSILQKKAPQLAQCVLGAF